MTRPIANTKSVANTNRSAIASTPVVRSDAINMISVKIAHAYRYSENPAWVTASAGSTKSRT